MLLKWVLIFLVVEVICSDASQIDQQEGECLYEEKTLDGQFIKDIHLEKPAGVKYTWDWKKGTSNITISHSKNLEVTNSFSNGVLKVSIKVLQESGGIKTSNSLLGLVLSVFLSITFFYYPNGNKNVTFWLLVLLVIVSCTYSLTLNSCNESEIHIKVPIDYLNRICVNQEECVPVKCPLSFTSVLSTFPSNNKVLFSDQFCTLKKPDEWDEWVQHFFKTNVSTERYLLMDNDNDGLVNFLEYYGGINFFNTTDNSLNERKRRSLLNVASIGTDPTNPDSDGDLLLDGFEFSNGMSPKRADDKNADNDNDGLSNLDEQIRQTDPLNPDTDGDGVNDGDEVTNNSDPKDPSDQGQVAPEQSFAKVKLTIGDPSGSHSERYVMTVGQFKHQAPDYGELGSGVYQYFPGKYNIRIAHIDSNLKSPDYDYLAVVEKVSGNATIEVIDPKGILGSHYESTTDYTLGKSATLIVKGKAGESGDHNCLTYKTCEECGKNKECSWRKSSKSCFHFPSKNRLIFLDETCACTACRNWYETEKKDTRWLKKLNEQFKCPCQAKFVNSGKLRVLKEVDNPSNVEWRADPTCTNPESSGCASFHPGASGCLRSVSHTDDDAGQQCCYGSDGKLLPAGSRGAGTPDKQYSSWYNERLHYFKDVVPYNECCKGCEIDSYCDYYVKGVRKGDDSHCTK